MTNRTMLGTWLALTMLAAGCAATRAPPELVDARKAYARAKTDPDARLVQAEIDEAKRALGRAERAFSRSSDELFDIAYLATRQAEIAESRGNIAAAQARRTQAAIDLEAAQSELQRLIEGQARENQAEAVIEPKR